MPDKPELYGLAVELESAKQIEANAKDARVRIEEQLIAKSGFKKPEGQETYTALDFALEIKQPINVTVDAEAWRKLRRTLPAKHPGRKVFVQKFSLDTKAARALQESDPQAWAEISDVISRKPGKIGVTVKKKET